MKGSAGVNCCLPFSVMKEAKYTAVKLKSSKFNTNCMGFVVVKFISQTGHKKKNTIPQKIS